MVINLQFSVFLSITHNSLSSKSATYINREVKESRHPLHCNSGVIFGHYSNVLEERAEQH